MGTNFSHLAIVVNKDNSFFAEFPNLTKVYRITHSIDKDGKAHERWNTDNLAFYQSQFNFAVYCATTGCGVGWDLLNDTNPYIAAIFNFHVYFTVRKILYDMQSPIPGDDAFEFYNNHYDSRAFADTCQLFGASQEPKLKPAC